MDLDTKRESPPWQMTTGIRGWKIFSAPSSSTTKWNSAIPTGIVRVEPPACGVAEEEVQDRRQPTHG
jgi:hypothetical protein